MRVDVHHYGGVPMTDAGADGPMIASSPRFLIHEG
jgi:hypothetical protein